MRRNKSSEDSSDPVPTWKGPMPTWSEEQPRVDIVPCAICTALPTERHGFDQQLGIQRYRSTRRFEGYWCQSCAQSIGRRTQSRTLLTGWLGLTMFVENIAIVLENSSELRAVAAMEPPVPNDRTLAPGIPVLARVAIFVVIALTLAAAAYLIFR